MSSDSESNLAIPSPCTRIKLILLQQKKYEMVGLINNKLHTYMWTISTLKIVSCLRSCGDVRTPTSPTVAAPMQFRRGFPHSGTPSLSNGLLN